MVPAKNSNRALIVQTDEGCDWSVQLGNIGGGDIAYYDKIAKNDSDGESSRNDDSSWDNNSLDEVRSTSGKDRSKDDGAEVGDVITETKSTDSDEAALEHETKGSSDEFSMLDRHDAT
ncbi:hypothetical protein Hanom_Chr06g00553601 [Helianthus anomalus]